jgi:hypothetical protein
MSSHHALIALEHVGLPGTALDQLGMPRSVETTVQWRLSGEPLCMGRLWGNLTGWSVDGVWAGNTAGLLEALAGAAEAHGTDPDKMRFWMRYSPAAEAAAASGNGPTSGAEPPDAPDAADPSPLHGGGASYMDVGVLSGQRLVLVTPEQVPTHFAEKPEGSWIISYLTCPAPCAVSQARTQHVQLSSLICDALMLSSAKRDAISMGIPTHPQVHRRLPQLPRRVLSLGFNLASQDAVKINMVALCSFWGQCIYVPGALLSGVCGLGQPDCIGLPDALSASVLHCSLRRWPGTNSISDDHHDRSTDCRTSRRCDAEVEGWRCGAHRVQQQQAHHRHQGYGGHGWLVPSLWRQCGSACALLVVNAICVAS